MLTAEQMRENPLPFAVDLAGKRHLEAWLKRRWDRPAAKKARALREGQS